MRERKSLEMEISGREASGQSHHRTIGVSLDNISTTTGITNGLGFSGEGQETDGFWGDDVNRRMTTIINALGSIYSLQSTRRAPSGISLLRSIGLRDNEYQQMIQ